MNETENMEPGLLEQMKTAVREVLVEFGFSSKAEVKPEKRPFDINRVKAKRTEFINFADEQQRREEVVAIRNEILTEVRRHGNIDRWKTHILEDVFSPRCRCKTFRRMPTASEANELFGDLLDGIADASYNPFRRDMERRFPLLANKMKRGTR